MSVTPGLGSAGGPYTYSLTTVNIYCYVYANPLATVEWYKDGHLMEENENVIIEIPEEGGNHILRLKGMGHRLGYRMNINDTKVLREDRLGIYECR